jgi:hypothetical protein
MADTLASTPASAPAPLFDMSKAQPVAAQTSPVPATGQPLFDMSKAQPLSQPEQPSIISRAATGVGQSLNQNFVEPVKAIAQSVVTPPEDHKEQIVHSVGGTPALQLYRFGRFMVDNAEKLIEAPKEEYKQAVQDFQRGIGEVQKQDYRGALASAGSTVADMIGTMPGPGAIVGPKARELSEGTRPGADLAGPLAKDATDVASLLAGEKAPEIVEGAKGLAGKAAKTVGVGGLEPAEGLQKAAGGSAGIAEKNFKSNMDRAMKYIPEEHKINAIEGSPESLADAADSAKTKLWDKFMGQINDMMSGKKITYSTAHGMSTLQDAWVDGKAIAQDIKDSVSDFTRNHEASAAKKIDKWADTFATAYPDGKYPLDKAAKAVSNMNAKLRNTYQMDSGARTALLTRNPEMGMYEDAADSIRQKLDDKLTKWGHTDSAELRKDYGALAQMQRVFDRRAITYGRQVPISLKQGLGYLAGAAGHPAATAAMLAEKYLNSPEYLIKNAIDKAAGPSTPVVGPAAKVAIPAAVGSNWIRFKGGDGQVHEAHPEDWEQVQKVDPAATKIE